jgi:hypothetical protein
MANVKTSNRILGAGVTREGQTEARLFQIRQIDDGAKTYIVESFAGKFTSASLLAAINHMEESLRLEYICTLGDF